MPDYNIPASTFAQIPMAAGNLARPQTVQPFAPVDVPLEQTRAYAMEAAKGESQAKVQSQQDEQRDKMIVEQYKQSGGEGDFVTPEGIEQSLKDLKGQISDKGYNNLANLLGQKKAADYKLQAELSKADEAHLAKITEDMEFANRTFNAPMVEAYKNTLEKTKDVQKATEAFNTAKAAAIEMASGITDVSGKPKYSPQVIEKMKKATPEEVEHIYELSDFYAKRTKQEQDRRLTEAKTGLFEAKSETEEAYGGIKGTSKIAEIRRMIASGEISAEEGKKMMEAAQTAPSGKGWKMTSVGGKVYRINPNEGKIQSQTGEGEWEDIAPNEMPKDLVESLGGKKAQSAITQRYNQRTMTAAGEVLRNVDMIGMMPLGQTSGVFNYDPAGGLSAALKNKLTPEEAIDYNTAMSGLGLELTTVLRGGMQMNEAEIKNITEGARANPGDSVANTRFKLANVIAKTKVALENFEPSSEQQAKQKEEYIKQLDKYPSPEDVYKENQTGKLKRKTAAESLQETKRRAEAGAARGAAPTGMQVPPEEQRSRDDTRLRILNEERAAIQANLAKTPNDPKLAQEFKDIDTEIGALSKKPGSKRGAAQIAKISSNEEYAALPSGSVFIGPDGKQRRKP